MPEGRLMKNKGTTVLLTIVLLIVWGTIGYKIYSNTHSSDAVVTTGLPVHFSPPKMEESEDYSLSLEYDDPFIAKKKEKKELEKCKVGNNQVNWPDIKYKGCIYHGKSVMGIVDINGKSFFVRKGDNAENIRIVNIHKTTLDVIFNNERKSFNKAVVR
jgi:hypothetical protein